jgi:hypothetical protein
MLANCVSLSFLRSLHLQHYLISRNSKREINLRRKEENPFIFSIEDICVALLRLFRKLKRVGVRLALHQRQNSRVTNSVFDRHTEQ